MKNDPVYHFIGSVDELNSHLGLVKSILPINDSTTVNFITCIQKNLMKIMSFISLNDELYSLSDSDVDILQKETNRLKDITPKQHSFVLPGKNITEAQIHITRTVTRRAERMYYALYETEGQTTPMFCQIISDYLNKLSDYLFILSLQKFSLTE